MYFTYHTFFLGAISGQLIDSSMPYHTVTATVGASRRQKRAGPGGRALPFNVSETNLENFQVTVLSYLACFLISFYSGANPTAFEYTATTPVL
jgi:hypothetical protein